MLKHSLSILALALILPVAQPTVAQVNQPVSLIAGNIDEEYELVLFLNPGEIIEAKVITDRDTNCVAEIVFEVHDAKGAFDPVQFDVTLHAGDLHVISVKFEDFADGSDGGDERSREVVVVGSKVKEVIRLQGPCRLLAFESLVAADGSSIPIPATGTIKKLMDRGFGFIAD